MRSVPASSRRSRQTGARPCTLVVLLGQFMTLMSRHDSLKCPVAVIETNISPNFNSSLTRKNTVECLVEL